jgi:hypothetical protein
VINADRAPLFEFPSKVPSCLTFKIQASSN